MHFNEKEHRPLDGRNAKEFVETILNCYCLLFGQKLFILFPPEIYIHLFKILQKPHPYDIKLGSKSRLWSLIKPKHGWGSMLFPVFRSWSENLQSKETSYLPYTYPKYSGGDSTKITTSCWTTIEQEDAGTYHQNLTPETRRPEGNGGGGCLLGWHHVNKRPLPAGGGQVGVAGWERPRG